MEVRVQELEAQVAQLSTQRDELYRDIETLCTSKGKGSSRTATTALLQRANEAERLRDALATENNELKAENASLLEDLASLQNARKQTDAYCRELTVKHEDLMKQKALLAKRHSRASCESLTLLDDVHQGEGLLGGGYEGEGESCTSESSMKREEWNEATEHAAQVEEELISLANVPHAVGQLERANEEIALLQQRVESLEESLEDAHQELEDAQDDARRREHHVSTLLDQLEKAQNDPDDKKSTKGSKRSSRSLQKKLDRMSLDLTKAFSKMRSKEDALSETEAEMDSMKRRHSSDIMLVREAFDTKFQETKKLIAQKDEMIEAQQHSLQLMELEKRKLLSQINRRDLVLSRLRNGRLSVEENGRRSADMCPDSDDSECKRKLDGLEAKIKMLERQLHHSTLKLEATEQQKKDALLKASAYKKKYMVLKQRMKGESADSHGLPLLESNLHLHNFSTRWEDALNQARTRPGGNSRSPSRRPSSRTGSISSRYSQISIAQFALVALMMNGMGKQQ